MADRIEGARVALVPFVAAHIGPVYLGWLNDSELMRYSSQRTRHHTAATSLAYLATFDGVSSYFWAMEDRERGGLIGTMTAYVDRGEVANIGILLGSRWHHGKGYACEAWGLAMDWLFKARKVAAVEGGTDSRNEAMVGIFRHFGMLQIGRAASGLDPGAVDVLFRIERGAWPSAATGTVRQ